MLQTEKRLPASRGDYVTYDAILRQLHVTSIRRYISALASRSSLCIMQYFGSISNFVVIASECNSVVRLLK